MHEIGDAGDLDALRQRASALATAWGAAAASVTTIGQERAILRLLGVSGLDRRGRPLAAEVVERYLGPDAGRVSAGARPVDG